MDLHQMVAAVEWYNKLTDQQKELLINYAKDHNCSLSYTIQYHYDLLLRDEKIIKKLNK